MLIRHKLAWSSIFLILLSIAIGVLCLVLVGNAQKDVDQTNVELVPHSAAATRMSESLLKAYADVQEMIRWAYEAHHQLEGTVDFKVITDRKMAKVEACLDDLQQAIAECRTIINSNGLRAAQLSGDHDEVQSEYVELEKLAKFDRDCEDLRRHLSAMGTMLSTNSEQAFGFMNRQVEPDFRSRLLPEIQEYRDNIWNEMKSENTQITTHLRHIGMTIVILIFLLLVARVGVAFWVFRAVSEPITRLHAAVERIGRGELDVTVPATSNDELGSLARAFNRMTEDLRQTTVSKEYMDGVIHSMGDMLAVINHAGEIQDVNTALLRSLGYDKAGLIGKPIDFLLSLPQIPIDASSRENLRDGSVRHFEAAYRRKDGQLIPVSLSVSALRDRQTVLHGQVWIAKDISERKRAELQLEEAHQRLMTASRQAGMAEVATSVLHNVGNVLNSLNVSTGVVAEHLRRSKVGNVSRIAGLLRDNAHHLSDYLSANPAGKQLPLYMERLGRHLDGEQTAILREINQMQGGVNHIRDIVAMQQNYARLFGLIEKTRVVDLVEDALRMNVNSLARHEVQVVRDYAPSAPDVLVDKHKAIQILVNLIRNAKYACDESGRKDKRITVRTEHDDKRVRISIADNGIGIPGENMSKIFQHGFTTRKQGHGFGLHSAALAADEMGGRLFFESKGVQQGARFTLELPLQPAAKSGDQSAETNS